MGSFLYSFFFIYVWMIIISLSSFVFGILLGGEIGELSFLWFSYRKIDGKYMWTRQRLFLFPTMSISGAELMADRKKKMIWNVLNDICIIITALLMAWYMKTHFTGNDNISMVWWTTCIFIIAFVSIMLLINLYVYYGNSTLSIISRENSEYCALMYKGVRPKDNIVPLNRHVELAFFSSDHLKNYVTYQYYKALDNRDISELTRTVHCMEQAMTGVSFAKFNSLMYSECMFYYSFVEPDTKKAKYYKRKFSRHMDDMDVNDRRVYAYYLYYVQNDHEQAMQMIEKGLENAENFQDKGNIVMEKELLYYLRDTIEGKTQADKDIGEGVNDGSKDQSIQTGN